jgi:hypothetical protein
MATTTTNFGWDIPQSTDLVKDGATAIAALGQDIDTALIDLKGGTTGQVLAKASGTDLDFTWSTAANAGMTLLSTTTLSGASTTISTISGSYNELFIVMRSVQPATDGTNVLMRFNSDTGSNYDSSAWDGSGNFVSATSIELMSSVDSATTVTGATLTIPDYANTSTYKYCYWVGSGVRGAGSNARFQMTGHWANANAITSITFLPASGNWTSGTILIYGVK